MKSCSGCKYVSFCNSTTPYWSCKTNAGVSARFSPPPPPLPLPKLNQKKRNVGTITYELQIDTTEFDKQLQSIKETLQEYSDFCEGLGINKSSRWSLLKFKSRRRDNK